MFNRRPLYPNRQKVFRGLLLLLVAGCICIGLDKLGALNGIRSAGERLLVLPVKQFWYDRKINNTTTTERTDEVNKVLKLTIAQLDEENYRLKQIVGLSPFPEWHLTEVKVVGAGGDTFTIFGGSSQGIAVGIVAVVAEDKMIYVGRIKQVTPNQAQVALPSDYGNRIDVVILPKANSTAIYGRGLVIGHGAGQITVEQILNQEKVQNDDLVAYQYRDRLLFLGSITGIKTDESGIFQSAQVKPAANIGEMMTLFLVN